MSRSIVTLALPLTTAMLLSSGAIAQSTGQQSPAQPQQQQRQHTQQTQERRAQNYDAAAQHTMRGCVAQDPSARGQVGASQMTGAEQTALLTKVSMPSMAGHHGTVDKAADKAGAAHAAHKAEGKDGKTYRLVARAQSQFQLAEFVGKQVEVRGTIAPQPTPADEVKDTARAAQGDTTVVDSPATDFDDEYKALTVLSISKTADSCADDSDN